MIGRKSLKIGDKVRWETSQGETDGVIVKKVTAAEKADGHTARSTRADPEYRIKSATTGKEAIHRSEALRKE